MWKYNLYLVIDPLNSVAESDEGNNQISFALTVINDLPDLVLPPAGISYTPNNPFVGDIIQISYIVLNKGSMDCSQSVNIEFYDGVPGAGNIIGAVQVSEPIATGGTTLVNFSWNTEGASEGPHEIYAVVDRENNITESNEDNNQTKVCVYLYTPDIMEISAPVITGPTNASTPITVSSTPITVSGYTDGGTTVEVFVSDGTNKISQETVLAAGPVRLHISTWEDFVADSMEREDIAYRSMDSVVGIDADSGKLQLMEQWGQIKIEETGYLFWPKSTIGLDGTIHVIWAIYDLYQNYSNLYYTNSKIGWVPQVVHSGGCGEHSYCQYDAVVDSQNIVHIFWVRGYNPGSFDRNLYYANSSDGWGKKEIYKSPNLHALKATIDSNDVIHLICRYGQNWGTMYTNSALNWEWRELPFQADHIAVDSKGVVHLTEYVWVNKRIAYGNSSNNFEPVYVSLPFTCFYHKMEIDKDGIVHIMYGDTNRIWYTNSLSNWETREIIDDMYKRLHPSDRLYGTDLAVDSQGNVYIMWYYSTVYGSYWTGVGYTSSLFNWKPTKIVVPHCHYTGDCPDLLIDSEDNIHIVSNDVYGIFCGNNTDLAQYITQGTWKKRFNMGEVTDFDKIVWNSIEEEGVTNIKFRTRTATDEAGLQNAEWSGYYDISGSLITSSENQWIEIEATLETTDGKKSPVLYDFTVFTKGKFSLDGVNLTSGENYITAVARDSLGNVSPECQPITVILEEKPRLSGDLSLTPADIVFSNDSPVFGEQVNI